MSGLIVVSNRLPVTIERVAGEDRIRTSTGGLVSALRPLLQRLGGCWIGSCGMLDKSGPDDLLRSAENSEGFQLRPVFLPERLRQDFYAGFCNEILWPLFHDLQSHCKFEPRYWHGYLEANMRFRDAVVSRAGSENLIWVQDYHLMLQGKLLAARHLRRENLVYFHHIPFPPPDVFEKLPWRKEILEGLLGFGLIGFQSARDRYNFLACLRRLLPKARLRTSRNAATLGILHESAETLVGTFPIGIDFEDFRRTSMQKCVIAQAETIRRRMQGRRIVLGVDRLDYTKGILERIQAVGALLERYPGLRGRVVLIQIAVPSREDIRTYQDLKRKLEALVEETNARFKSPDWTPIQYLNCHLSRAELVAYYRAADVALITPVKDGMNLVCKEFCAARVDDTGILILSEFTGAAHQLRTGALLVNPYDTEGLTAVLYRALEMDPRDANRRMRRMRRNTRREDVYDWCTRVLSTVGASVHNQGIAPGLPADLAPDCDLPDSDSSLSRALRAPAQ